MHKLLIRTLTAGTLLTPALVLAANGSAPGSGIGGVIAQISSYITMLIPIVIGLGVLVFLWGVLKYVVAKDEESQKEARGVMLYGIIVLFVMVSVWGLVNILRDTLSLTNSTPSAPGIPVPTAPGASGN